MGNASTPTPVFRCLSPLGFTCSQFVYPRQIIFYGVIKSFLSFKVIIDGSHPPPPTTITAADGTSSANPAYLTWKQQDQCHVSLLNSSLTKEAMAEVFHCDTSHAIWLALEAINNSKQREISIRDWLLQLKKGTSSVRDYAKQFKGFCAQLASMGHPVDELDKFH